MRGHCRDAFRFRWELAESLRRHAGPVHQDGELTATAFNAVGLNAEFLVDQGRHPGRPWTVISDLAVMDFEFGHDSSQGSTGTDHSGIGSGSGMGQVSPQ